MTSTAEADRPSACAKRHAKERDGRKKNRLLAVKLAARGEQTSAEIADFCGIARGHLFRWMKTVREQGSKPRWSARSPARKRAAAEGGLLPES